MAAEDNERALEILSTLAKASRTLLSIDSPYAAKLQEDLALVLNDTLDTYMPPQVEFTKLQRQVLNRHYYAGQTLREVAKATSKTYDYVRSVNMSVRNKLADLSVEDITSAFDDAWQLSHGGRANIDITAPEDDER